MYCFRQARVVETRCPNMALQKNRKLPAGVKIKMKRFLLSLWLSVFFALCFMPSAFAAGDRSVTILYTGGARGAIEPCIL